MYKGLIKNKKLKAFNVFIFIKSGVSTTHDICSFIIFGHIVCVKLIIDLTSVCFVSLLKIEFGFDIVTYS